jgi:hypothetical protein
MAEPIEDPNLPSDAVLDTMPARGFQFLGAVSVNPAIRAVFAQRGYTEEIHQIAWADVLKAAGFRKEALAAFEQPGAAAALATIDAWDDPTFRVARGVLAPFPTQLAFVFNGLEAQKGVASVGSAKTFLDRLDELETSKDRKATRKEDLAAIAKLAARRIDAAERARLRGLIAIATGFTDSAGPGAEKNATLKEEQRKAKIAVWYYLTEWGEIAKSDITRRDYLIQLGLAKRKKPNKGPKGGGGEGGGGGETGGTGAGGGGK